MLQKKNKSLYVMQRKGLAKKSTRANLGFKAKTVDEASKSGLTPKQIQKTAIKLAAIKPKIADMN